MEQVKEKRDIEALKIMPELFLSGITCYII